MNYKYCIKKKLDGLSVQDYKRLRRLIPLALGKTRKTFERYCTLTIDEHGDIPAYDLDVIAECLDCTADELKNYSDKDIKQLVVSNKQQLKKYA